MVLKDTKCNIGYKFIILNFVPTLILAYNYYIVTLFFSQKLTLSVTFNIHLFKDLNPIQLKLINLLLTSYLWVLNS